MLCAANKPSLRITLIALAAACTPSVGDAGDPDEDPQEPGSMEQPRRPPTADGASRPPTAAGDAGPPVAAQDGPRPPARDDGANAVSDTSAPPSMDAAPNMVMGPPTLDFSPTLITFTTSVEVIIKPSDSAATVYYTTDDKVPTMASTKYQAPIRLMASTIIRAFAVSPTQGPGSVYARLYIKLENDTANFSSDIPVIVLHSFRPRVSTKADGVRPGTITIFEPDPQTRRASVRGAPSLHARMGINIRGSSSSGWPKRPYKVETWTSDKDEDMSVPFLGMPAESDWVFFPGWNYDRALVRNQVMFALSNQLGRYAPRTRVAEVFYTDAGRGVAYADYVGLYVVMEKIKVDKNRVAIQKLTTLDTAQPAITGGYIFAVDRVEPPDVGLNAGYGPAGIWNSVCPMGVIGLCQITAAPSRVVFKTPKEMELVSAQRNYLRDTVNAFGNALATKTYEDHIDVPSFVDHHILNIISKNADALRLSGYFHKNRSGKIIAGPIWDFDRSLGCATDRRCPEPDKWDGTNITPDFTNFFYFGWWRGLFQDDKFKQTYWTRFRQLVQAELSNAKIQLVIDQEVAKLGKEAPARNFMRWTADAPAGGHAAEVTRLKDWVTRRMQWIQGCLARTDPAICP